MRAALALGCLVWVTGGAQAQALSWIETQTFQGRKNLAMAYDAARGRLVVFGGSIQGNDLPSAQTWERDGDHWILRHPAASPPARRWHAMAWDAARAVVVLFGGNDGNGQLADTWEWDGDDWVRRTPAQSPPARQVHAMAYDSARARTVLFAGDGAARYADTWEWDGTTWSQRTPGNAPAPRREHCMAYDAARQRVVVFGGQVPDIGGDRIVDETWEWDGATWTQRTPAIAPPGRFSARMAYDAARQRVVLFGGGTSPSLPPDVSDVWEWDGNAWTSATPAAMPPPRYFHAMAWDGAHNRVTVVGGTDAYDIFGDTWRWDGTTWTQARTECPPARSGAAAAYDPVGNRVVVFGGQSGRRKADTWQWDGGAWSEIASAAAPAARFGPVMCFDATAQELVLFGGSNGTVNPPDDTWTLRGSTWTLRASGQVPARFGHDMAHDSARGRTVLFGGTGFGVPAYDDTWEWDGVSWTQRAPAQHPSARQDHAMAYDAGRRRVVLFGGWRNNAFLGDTWEWDGSNWMQVTTPAAPTARAAHAMVYDPDRGVVRIHGGSVLNGQLLTDTWEWNGSSWSAVATGSGPAGRGNHACAYDSLHRRSVVFGGSVEGFGAESATWLLGALTPAQSQAFGSACSGRAGLPRLASTRPTLGHPALVLDLTHARPSAPCAHALAATQRSLAIGGGCTVYVGDPMVLVASATNAAGFATLQFPVPPQRALVGATLFAQSVILDPQAAIGAAFTAGRQLVIGD